MLRVVGTLVLLALTAWWVDVEAVGRTLARARLWPLAVAWLVSVPLMVTLAGRWHFTARRMGIEITLGAAVREYYVSLLLNQVIPGGVAGDVGRAIRVGQHNPDARGAAARSVVLERVSGQVALWLVVLVGLGLWGAEAGARMALTVLGIAAGIGALVVLLVRIPALSKTWVGRWWSTLTREAREAFVDRGAWLVQLGLSLLSVAGLIAMYAACVAAVGAEVRVVQLLFIAPTLLAITALPLSVGGWGLREAASAALFELTGLDPTAGVAASAALGAINFMAALPGAFLWARWAPAAPDSPTED